MKACTSIFATITLSVAMIGVVTSGRAADPTVPLGPLGQFHQQHHVTCTNCHQTTHPKTAASATGCLTCHSTPNANGKYLGTAKQYTFDGGVPVVANPHQSHLVELPCTECHKVHTQSVLYCNQCHLIKDMNVK